MFTKRHEQELSEIKALTHDLNRRFQQIAEQLARIQEAQDQLAAEPRAATPTGTPSGARSGAKRARRRQATPGATTGGKQGKRRTKRKHQPALRSGADEE